MHIAVEETVRVGQHVTVKAEVANLTEVRKTVTDSDRFTMVHSVLADPSISMKLILWESFVNSVLVGSTCLFHSLTVRKDKFTDEIYLVYTHSVVLAILAIWLVRYIGLMQHYSLATEWIMHYPIKQKQNGWRKLAFR